MKPNTTKEELAKIKTEVDWKSLEKRITDKIDIRVELEVKIKEGIEDYSPYLKLESQELIEHIGIMAAAFRSIKVEDSRITFSPDKNIMTVVIGYRWEYQYEGGSNGCILFRAHYSFENKKWKIKSYPHMITPESLI